MDARLDGKVALVTGAGGDLGAETAALMIARGAAVAGLDRDPAALERVGRRLPAGAPWLAVTADVTDEGQVAVAVRRTREAFGALHVLFNGAGIEGGAGAAWRLTPDVERADFDRVFAVNVAGVFLMMKHAIPALVEAGGGSIVNVASVAALRPGAGQIAYAASKAAVIGLTRTAAQEWSEHGVRVNAIAPGLLEGRMMEQIAAGMTAHLGGEPAGLRDAIIPLGRWGRPAEVAALAVFLASDRGAFITGGVHPVDGGFSA